jgi:hypothetical protein
MNHPTKTVAWTAGLGLAVLMAGCGGSDNEQTSGIVGTVPTETAPPQDRKAQLQGTGADLKKQGYPGTKR